MSLERRTTHCICNVLKKHFLPFRINFEITIDNNKLGLYNLVATFANVHRDTLTIDDNDDDNNSTPLKNTYVAIMRVDIRWLWPISFYYYNLIIKKHWSVKHERIKEVFW